jgi:septum formation inhibitor-activating ATPase MinD
VVWARQRLPPRSAPHSRRRVRRAERRVVFDLINVVQGVARLSQALIRDKRLETLWLLPASQTRDKDALTEAGVAGVIKEMRSKFDWVLCDSPGHRARRNSRDAVCRCRGQPIANGNAVNLGS